MSAAAAMTEAGRALAAAQDRLELLADAGGDAEFQEATEAWFEAMATFSDALCRVTGLTRAQLAERLVP